MAFSAQAASDEGWAASLAEAASLTEAAALARRSRATLNVVQPPRAPLAPGRELARRAAAAAWAVRPVAAPTALAAPRGGLAPDGMTPSGRGHAGPRRRLSAGAIQADRGIAHTGAPPDPMPGTGARPRPAAERGEAAFAGRHPAPIRDTQSALRAPSSVTPWPSGPAR